VEVAGDLGEPGARLEDRSSRGGAEAARRRAAVEQVAQHGATLKRVGRRYSLCAADAEDAYQRTLEILLTKAPLDRGRDLLAWSKTVVKHEALAIRRNRERLLGTARAPGEEHRDPIALIPSGEDGPAERLERREEVARSREALRALKPAELRALTLLAEGYTYAEIGEITGFSRTKVNRCLAEGRERFRSLVSRGEDGRRCAEMGLLLSPFCDGETGPEETAAVREHLRACAGCRATVLAYRLAPARVAVLAPALPASRSLLERVQELLLGAQARLPGLGGGADASVAQVATGGGARGVGVAGLAKLLAVCAGTVGGTAACVMTGVAPAPVDLARDRGEAPRIERVSERVVEVTTPAAPLVVEEPAAPDASARQPEATAQHDPEAQAAAPVEAETGAVESPGPVPAPPMPPPAAEAPTSASGSAAGEFGP
jgi:RNA polymerase sigma factor (sigma-70 family)